MNLGALLSRNIGGLPAWAWAALVGGGGLALFLFIRRSQGGISSSAGQQQQSSVDMSQIDPNTGVPYSIEEAVNPATGLPAYYGGPGVDQAPPGPAQSPTPPTPAPPTTPIPPDQPVQLRRGWPGQPGAPTTAPAPSTASPPPVAPVSPDHPTRRRVVRRRPGRHLTTRTATRNRMGNGPDDAGQGPDEGQGPDDAGSGPNGGACPFGLACGGGCRGHCQTQATPFWPQMTDTGVY